jgi:RNA polymerase sigma-70 factor (ECF subfamily)
MTPFENLYKKYYRRLYTLAFRMTGSADDAEDVLQTAFLNAYSAYGNFRGESSPYTWLYRIVVNTAKRYVRFREKLPITEYAEKNDTTEAEVYAHINSFGRVEDEVLVTLTRETCLQMFMNCMPDKYRAVFTLRRILHCSTSETAEILEISEDAVKTNLHRARRIIRDHFEGRCSLIKPGSLCNCRGYAAFLEKNRRTSVLLDIKIARRVEK